MKKKIVQFLTFNFKIYSDTSCLLGFLTFLPLWNWKIKWDIFFLISFLYKIYIVYKWGIVDIIYIYGPTNPWYYNEVSNSIFLLTVIVCGNFCYVKYLLTFHSLFYNKASCFVRNKNDLKVHRKHNMINIVRANWSHRHALNICHEFFDHILHTIHMSFHISPFRLLYSGNRNHNLINIKKYGCDNYKPIYP